MPKIVLTGARGQLGADLARLLEGRDVTALGRDGLDVTDARAVVERIRELAPEVVINAAAYNRVDLAEERPREAFRTNAVATLGLARACEESGALLVHFSTDYVFAGDRRRPYREEDPPGPASAYAASKLDGERFARAAASRHMVIRTSGLYGLGGHGGKGGNFVETMLRLGAERKPIRVVDDQVLSPTFSEDLARVVILLVEHWHGSRAEDLLGLYHVTNAGETSWFGFAQEIFRRAGVEADLRPISTAEYGAAARRPGYSVLAPGHLERLGIPPPRPWRDALADYLRRRTGVRS